MALSSDSSMICRAKNLSWGADTSRGRESMSQTKPSIVFAHGLWADGSCFSKLIPTLQAEGHEVMASQHGLDSLATDVAAVKACLARVPRPAILVGHSYGEVLPSLTSEDLKDLGISFIGHRRKILSAIADLPAPAAAPSAPKPSSDNKRASSDVASERRQLTLMFCDLVGSTPLSAQLDPEDMADLIRAFRDAVSASVSRFDGNVAKWMGDGALVYFGYPHAHEDDAERAARASLALQGVLRDLS